MDETAKVSGNAEKDGVKKEKGKGPQKRRTDLDSFRREMLEGKSMHINRVPPATKKRFKEFCAKEFNDDYGMGLTYLMDRYEDYKMYVKLLEGQVDIHKRLNQIEAFLYELTHQEVEEVEQAKTTMGGKRLVPIGGGKGK